MASGAQKQIDQQKIHTLHRLGEALSHARTVEQVYAMALNTVRELFKPDRAFVSLSQLDTLESAAKPVPPGWLEDVLIPIYAGERFVGKFVLQYEPGRNFSEYDLTLIGLIAMQCGAHIHFMAQSDADRLAIAILHGGPRAGVATRHRGVRVDGPTERHYRPK
jgi:hypothetical protein